MSLSHHIDAESILAKSKDHPAKRLIRESRNQNNHVYSTRYATGDLPKYQIPSKGTDPDAAYQLIHDELSLDGMPTLNLASFVHTWMPDQATKLMMENISKNLIDQDEYPVTEVIHTRCLSMIASLWHAPESKSAIGTGTTGSSEAIQLGGLALKKVWQAKMKAAGKDIHNPGPNIIMGSNAQVALEKFARYFDVECRLVPISEESQYCMDPVKAMEYVDENTIGVFVILGSTYTGHYENVQKMAELLDEYQTKTGIDVPIHVDAASGGFVAPFAHPHLKWDFRIPRVVSINTSGHKFGKVYVGVGCISWRDAKHLPKELIFELHYLGSTEYSFSLNFSRPAHPIIGQYWNLIHLGWEGYKNIAYNDFKNARLLSRALEATNFFTVLSDIHRPANPALQVLEGVKAVTGNEENPENYYASLPVVAFRFSDEFKKENPDVRQKWIQTLLRAKGWIVPNYNLSPNLEDVEILRVVVRENMSEDLIDRLMTDLIEITESLQAADSDARVLSKLTSKGENHHGIHHHEKKHAKEIQGGGTKPSGYARQC